jgi:nucleoside diphosphate kinase
MIKPDGVQRGLVAEIISRFEKKGLKLVGMKFMKPSKEHLEKVRNILPSTATKTPPTGTPACRD